MTNSRISGFYNLTLEERRAKLAEASGQTPESLLPFTTGGLSAESADHMIENVIGMYALPVGIGLNFMVNGRDVLIPFVVEEPSVVAGASFMAKLARAGGGFTATTTVLTDISTAPSAGLNVKVGYKTPAASGMANTL